MGKSDLNRERKIILNWNWTKIWIASLFEVGWVVGLKHASTTWAWFGTGICILVSFYLMIEAGKHLPVGTVYAVFVGLGTAGTVFADLILFEQTVSWLKIGLITTLLLGVIGLKLTSEEEPNSNASVKEGGNS